MATSRFLFALSLLVGACRLSAGPNEQEPDAAVGDDVDAAVDAAGQLPDGALASSCTGDDRLICEGFEAGNLAGWQTDVSGGSLEIVSTPVFLGSGAVRMQSVTAGSVAQISRGHAAQTSGTLHTRFYLYLPSDLITTGLVELTNTGDGSGIHTHFGVNGNTPLILVNDNSEASPVDLPRDTWVCVEMALEIGANGGGELSIDGALVASSTGTDTAVPGGYDGGSFGLHYTADANGALDIYMDEIAVDDQLIGCL